MSVAGASVVYRPAAARGAFWREPPVIAVLGAMTFNFALCFVNTNVMGVGNTSVIACEIAIIMAVLFYAYRSLNYTQFLVIGAALLYLVTLAAARALLGNGFDVKPVRDFLIPIAFFILGAGFGDLKMADRIVLVIALVVLAVGLFEYMMPDVFTRYFNVAGYYIERGTMDAIQAQQSSDLFISGMRPDGADGGRNLLPFLGSHRVSSIFLEPVSAGNFGVIVFGWALVRSLAERRVYWLLFAIALTVVVLADSRYGAYFCIISLPLMLCPPSIRFAATAVLPVFGLATVLLVPDMLPIHYGVTNGFIGRIIMANGILDGFDTAAWFGLSSPGFTADSGYAYALAGAGIVGVAGFWLMFLAVRGHGSRFALFRDLTGAYIALLLCISNSPFTIKTGALLWFLMGTLSRPDPMVLRPRAVMR